MSFRLSGDFGASVYITCNHCHDDIAVNPATVDDAVAACAGHRCIIDTTATDGPAGDDTPACAHLNPGQWPYLCTRPTGHTDHHAAHGNLDLNAPPIATWPNLA